jgi:hypothetical protein
MESRYETLKKQMEKINKLDEFNKYIENLRTLVMRQTNYDEDTAIKKIIEHDLDVMKVIREYMNVSNTSKISKNKSTNQLMYGEFRKFLDDASRTHYRQKELEEMRQRKLQKIISNKIDNSRLEEMRQRKLQKIISNKIDNSSKIDNSNNVIF